LGQSASFVAEKIVNFCQLLDEVERLHVAVDDFVDVRIDATHHPVFLNEIPDTQVDEF